MLLLRAVTTAAPLCSSKRWPRCCTIALLAHTADVVLAMGGCCGLGACGGAALAGSVGGFFAASNTQRGEVVHSNAPFTAVTAGRQADLATHACVSGLSRGADPSASFGGTPLLRRVLLHKHLLCIDRTPQMSLAALDCAAEHMGPLTSRTSTCKCLQPLSLDSRVVHGVNDGISQAIAHTCGLQQVRILRTQRAEHQPYIDSWSRSV